MRVCVDSLERGGGWGGWGGGTRQNEGGAMQTIEGHVLDEADGNRSISGQLDKRRQLVVVDATLDDGVDLDGVRDHGRHWYYFCLRPFR